MELKIYNPQDNGFLQKIDWNFEDLKKEITAASQEYETSVYTDDTIKSAKADRAKLNKFVDALTGKRTDIRKALLKPDEQFGQEIKELTGIVQRAINNIDSQVKGYEQRQRENKITKVQEFYEENINDLAPVLPFDRVFKAEYANAATTMKSIKEDILSLIQRVGEGLAIINEVDSKFAGDMKEVFLRTYDIGAAMLERNRLEAAEEKRKVYEEELVRKKAEREAKVQEQTNRVIHAGSPSAPVKQPSTSQNIPTKETLEKPIHILDFRVHATKVQLDKLKEFLKVNNIRFEPVPKGEQ
jgi:hypothetical protein